MLIFGLSKPQPCLMAAVWELPKTQSDKASWSERFQQNVFADRVFGFLAVFVRDALLVFGLILCVAFEASRTASLALFAREFVVAFVAAARADRVPGIRAPLLRRSRRRVSRSLSAAAGVATFSASSSAARRALFCRFPFRFSPPTELLPSVTCRDAASSPCWSKNTAHDRRDASGVHGPHVGIVEEALRPWAGHHFIGWKVIDKISLLCQCTRDASQKRFGVGRCDKDVIVLMRLPSEAPAKR